MCGLALVGGRCREVVFLVDGLDGSFEAVE